MIGVGTCVCALNDTHLIFAEDTLWTGIPRNYTNSDVPEVLSEVRKLVDDGQYVEATTKGVKLLGDPSEVYQLLGDINLEFDDSHAGYDVETYQRELDLDTATAKVKYSVGEVEFMREHFASNPDQVIVAKISGSRPGSLSFTVAVDSKLHHHSYVNGKNQIIMEGSCPGKRIPPKVNQDDNPKGIQFSAVLDLQISNGVGAIHVLDDKKLRVEGSDWAVMFLVASSSFDGPFTKPVDSKRDPTSECLIALKAIRNFSYADLYAWHLEDYQKLFHRVSLHLSKGSKSVGENESSDTKNLLSCVPIICLEGGKPAGYMEQGYRTSMGPDGYLRDSLSLSLSLRCTPHLNINLQMNYWPSLPCNLPECQEPLFDYISFLSVNGTKTAQLRFLFLPPQRCSMHVKFEDHILVPRPRVNSDLVFSVKNIFRCALHVYCMDSITLVSHRTLQVNYKASGWVVHHVSDTWAKTSALQGKPVWALWPMGGAWLCTHLWEHYAYTADKGYLEKKAYPLLEGCTLFLLDWLIEGQGGYLETNPSTSPEHDFIAPDGRTASVSYSLTMDMAIIREVFSAVVTAAEVLGKTEDDLIERVRKAQPRLYPTKVAGDGSIMEWAQDFKDPEVHHRHLSHLFGLFPGHTITTEKTPDLCKAAAYTLLKRGEDGPGWSTTWKAALWACLRNSKDAYRMIKHLFILVEPDPDIGFEGGLYSNLFAAHPPFQIDANFGFSAAVSEMLVQSTMRDLYLVPALPRDKWANGCVKGLKARGDVTVNISWNEGDLQEVGLWSKNQNSVERLHYGGITVPVKMFDEQLTCVKTYSLEEAGFP
ncbi:hypothetical protein RHSIM_Rhsim10G0162100 [Rhododendron simsii]|uniref:Alpha-L-fucosidase n=1 Tax=Rhododendron simsii TaxID=118357 RepID=A0A834GAZ6_RHOSS|nr:hypothetical protein RHSIM_Rhsim10G0162100 [Rhododendron simsii]